MLALIKTAKLLFIMISV